MKVKTLVYALLLCALLPGGSLAAQRFLKGQVLQEGKHGELTAMKDVTVILTATGDQAVTDSQGAFRLYLREQFQPGEAVNLSLGPDTKGWRLFAPLGGDINLPANLDKQIIKLRVLPVGDKRFWTRAFVEKFLADTVSEARTEAIRTGEMPQVDMGRYIQDWAAAYGLDPREAKAEVDKWVARVEKKGDDTELLALAAFARGDFQQASELLEELTRKTSAQREQKRAELAAIDATYARQFETAGDVDFNARDYKKALSHYERALTAVSKESARRQWLSLKLSMAVAHVAQGEIDQGAAISQHLEAAKAIHDELLEVFNRQETPQEWARSQASLGNVLRSQGERAGKEDAVHLLRAAVHAYNAALSFYTHEQWPQQWATTKNNLGSALRLQGERAERKGAARLLADSVAAYRAALEVRTREQLPRDWAATQNNLAAALLQQSHRADLMEEATRLREEAIQACQAALEVRTRERMPPEWAITQNILGNVLLAQGERQLREASIDSLKQAVAAYRAVLEVRTRKEPQPWAMALSNLGNALSALGARSKGAQALGVLAEAVESYRAALTVLTRVDVPQFWAITQNNLGNALLLQGQKGDEAQAIQPLEEALVAYQAALDVFGSKALSAYWTLAHASRMSAWLVLAETHAASGDLPALEQTLQRAAQEQDVDVKTDIGLRTLGLLPLLAANRLEAVPARVDALHALVVKEPTALGLPWSRPGVLTRVTEDPRFAPFRSWLKTLFDAVANKNRSDLLYALENARKQLAR